MGECKSLIATFLLNLNENDNGIQSVPQADSPIPRLIIIGDSLATGYSSVTHEDINLSMLGADLSYLENCYELSGLNQGDRVVLSIGGNNIQFNLNSNPEEVSSKYYQRFESVIQKMRNEGAEVVIVGLNHVRSEEKAQETRANNLIDAWNKMYSAVAEKTGAVFVNPTDDVEVHRGSDGIHYDSVGSQMILSQALNAFNRSSRIGGR
jgi:hypothetical protein